MKPLAALALMSALTACGVAGRPRPPGPPPPASPGPVQLRTTPDGVEIRVPLVGEDARTEAVAHVFRSDHGACSGSALWRGPAGQWVSWPGALPVVVQSRVSRGPLLSEAGPATTLQRGAVPKAPEAPLAFVGAKGVVEITWLPPERATHVRILRNGHLVAEVAAETSTATDTPGPGRHQYVIQGVSARAISERSAGVYVKIAPRRVTPPGPRPQR
ncbi:MAG: hypothetical protein ACE366_25465 [Bradymonadia bacterium]